jgi:hypothetical protein
VGGALLPAGLAFILVGGIPIDFLIVAGSGIPGVGVWPGFIPFLSCSALGIPGVGVLPTGSTPPFAGMPGTPLTGSGLPDKPGGMFAGSSLIIFALLETELETELTLDVGDEPHADKRATTTKNKGKILNIYIGLLSIFKMAVPA